MHCIFNNNNNIYFNLAAEEFILKNKVEDIMMLWKSEPCVVVGKHQNVYAEINHKFINENNVSVARRLTGGGAVYHDRGNLNFSFIVNGEPGKQVDFKKFVSPVVEFLSTLGIKATIGEKNDILINGLKISGNAEHVHKNRVLHHGTLLFNSDLSILREALRVTPGRYIDRAVQSNRVSVTNISGHLTKEITSGEFSDSLYNFLFNKFPETTEYQFSEMEKALINNHIKEKYASWDWVYGYSPPFSLKRTIFIDSTSFSFELFIEKGTISKVETDKPESVLNLNLFIQNLRGMRYSYQELKKLIENSGLSDCIKAQLNEVLF